MAGSPEGIVLPLSAFHSDGLRYGVCLMVNSRTKEEKSTEETSDQAPQMSGAFTLTSGVFRCVCSPLCLH